jgi:hypothetical protein
MNFYLNKKAWRKFGWVAYIRNPAVFALGPVRIAVVWRRSKREEARADGPATA